MRLHAENELIETEDIKIQCGIFQGDSLSPFLFCICLIPLTEQLNRLNTGYEEHMTKTKISHLLYMDDLKLIAKSDEEVRKHIQTVRECLLVAQFDFVVCLQSTHISNFQDCISPCGKKFVSDCNELTKLGAGCILARTNLPSP